MNQAGKSEEKTEGTARANQKMKTLRLMQILLEKTDDKHSMTVQQMIDALEGYGITAERKSIYNDIEILKDFGLDIVTEQFARNFYYKVASRDFELAELKLLVDSIQSSKFITDRKSKELIRKLTGLASVYDAHQLNRQVYRTNRVKTMNEVILYSVDTIHEAISGNRQISFQYFNWTPDKKMELRHDGARYFVSPGVLYWDDENYYLIGYDHGEEKIKYFRVDKMLDVKKEELKRADEPLFKNFDIGAFAQKTFSMFAGEERGVTLLCENSMAGVMIDRFGKDVHMMRTDGDHFEVYVSVDISRQFIFWVLSLGDGVKITAPDDVVSMVKDELRKLSSVYS